MDGKIWQTENENKSEISVIQNTEENPNSLSSMSRKKTRILSAIPSNCKMFFPGDYYPVQKFVWQDIDISQNTKDPLYQLLGRL